MELLTQIWQSFGTPLTILFWMYIVIAGISTLCGLGVAIVVLRMFWKKRRDLF